MAQLSFTQSLILRRELKRNPRVEGQGFIQYIVDNKLFDEGFRFTLTSSSEARFQAEFKAVHIWAQLYEKSISDRDREVFGRAVALITFQTGLEKTKGAYSFRRAAKGVARLSRGCSAEFQQGLASFFQPDKRDDRDIVYGLRKLMSYFCSGEADGKAQATYFSVNAASYELGEFLSRFALGEFHSSSKVSLFKLSGRIERVRTFFCIHTPRPMAEVSKSSSVGFFMQNRSGASLARSGKPARAGVGLRK